MNKQQKKQRLEWLFFDAHASSCFTDEMLSPVGVNSSGYVFNKSSGDGTLLLWDVKSYVS